MDADDVRAPFTITPRLNEARARWVYVISRADGICKIGISRNVKRRLAGMQTTHPDRLTIFHKERVQEVPAVEIERGALLLLRRWRISGEWVSCRPALAVIAIRAAATGELRITEFIDWVWRSEQADAAWDKAREDYVSFHGSRDREGRLAAGRAEREAWEKHNEIDAEIERRFPDLWAPLKPVWL